MFTPIQAQCVFHLLLPTPPIPSKDPDGAKANKISVEFGAESTVPLGHYEEKLNQLAELNELLWVNGTCSDFDDFW